ncbi:MAG: molybdopterin biosynthesis protein, partial [Candidatus Cloacimonadota bacterium]
MERNVYLKKTEWKKALREFTNGFTSCFPLDSEIVPVRDSLHRVTACVVTSLIASPAFNSAAMDGIAVNAKITFEASPSAPKRLIVGMDCDFIDTGNPLEDTYNAVIKIEDVVIIDAKTVEVKYAVPPGKDVRFKGEDFNAGDFVIGESHLIHPVDIGAMLSCGVFGVNVRRKPRVAIIPTGSEIVEPGGTIR